MNLDRYAEFVGELLQLAFPQTHARTIAAAAVRRNHQSPRQRITNAANILPPTAYGLHGEGRRVIVDPDIHPARVGCKIINPIGHGATEFRNQKVVHTHFFWRALRTPFPTGVLEIADELLLLRIDGDHRLVLGQGGLDRRVDETELSVAVGIVGAFLGLAIGSHGEIWVKCEIQFRMNKTPVAVSAPKV